MKDISPRVLAIVVVVAVGALALIGWFGLISPQRSKASSLDGQIADAQTQLHTAKMLSSVQRSGKGEKSGLALLSTAMPQSVQMPSVLKEVQNLAAVSKVSLDSFSPTTATAQSGYDAVPINVGVSGRYTEVKGFLRRLRTQAGSLNGHIRATGRLFDVKTVGLTPGSGGAPQLTATITLAVFVYTGVPLPTTTTTTTGGAG
jgi:Tfp pilus assembly protein PilO